MASLPPPTKNVRTRKFQTKQAWVYAELKSAIQLCTIVPGERLILDDLAERYGVSRIPVREAIMQLQRDGLVELVPHMGATVSKLSVESIHDLFELLTMLQRLAVSLVIQRQSTDDVASLESVLAELQTATTEGDFERWTTLNLRFHREICSLSGLKLLLEFYDRINQEWVRFRNYLMPNVFDKRMAATLKTNQKLLSLLKQGDSDAAQLLIVEHNKDASDYYQACFAKQSIHPPDAD